MGSTSPEYAKSSEEANGKLKEKVSGIIKMEIEKEKVRAESSN